MSKIVVGLYMNLITLLPSEIIKLYMRRRIPVQIGEQDGHSPPTSVGLRESYFIKSSDLGIFNLFIIKGTEKRNSKIKEVLRKILSPSIISNPPDPSRLLFIFGHITIRVRLFIVYLFF